MNEHEQLNKKVIAINSGKPQGNTHRILLKLKRKWTDRGVDLTIFNLHDYDIKDCIGCGNCLKSNSCLLDDGAAKLMSEIEAGDGIILASPVYIWNVSGKMKSFADRASRWSHHPTLVGKPLFVVCTTLFTGINTTRKYLELTGMLWGLYPTGSICRVKKNMEKPIREKSFKNFLTCLFKDKRYHTISLKQLMVFQSQKFVNLFMCYGIQQRYWEEKGWDKKLFFYDCRINIFKRMFALLFYYIEGYLAWRK